MSEENPPDSSLGVENLSLKPTDVAKPPGHQEITKSELSLLQQIVSKINKKYLFSRHPFERCRKRTNHEAKKVDCGQSERCQLGLKVYSQVPQARCRRKTGNYHGRALRLALSSFPKFIRISLLAVPLR